MLIQKPDITSRDVTSAEAAALLRIKAPSIPQAFLRAAGYGIADAGGGELAFAVGRSREKTTTARVLL